MIRRRSESQKLRLKCRSCVRAALGVCVLFLTSGLHAADLFLPVDPAIDGALTAKSTSVERSTPVVPDAWERRVRVARQELTAAQADVESGDAGRLLLNVRSGVRLDVVVERTASTMWGYSLSGRVAGGGWGFVTLVVHEEAVAGSIWTPDFAYELTYLGGGVHALRDVTNAPLECGSASPSGELPGAEATTQGGTDDGSVVDILVVWTPAVEEGYGGGQAQVLSRIDMLIAYANDAFERSGAFVSLNLVGAEKVEYSEADSGDWAADSATNLGRLAVPDDGHMDHVHDRRDVLGADLVYLVTRRGSGRGHLLGGFSVGGDYGGIFAHEVGHNFGLKHERNELSAGTLTGGYRHGFTAAGCHETIMSYGTECYGARQRVVPFYASPWRYGPFGRALGVSRFARERGARGPADAVLTLSRTRHVVANFRPSRNRE